MTGPDAPRTPILHVLAGADPSDGGPAYSVPRLCEALGCAGAGVALMSVARTEAARRDVRGPFYRDMRYPWDYADIPVLRGLRASSGLHCALKQQAGAARLIHDHGLWLMPNLYAGWVAAQSGVPLMVAPRGMLSETARAFSPVKKQIFWKLLQGPAIRRVACFHATSEQEYEDIRSFGLRAPVAVIPNGIDIPQLADDSPRDGRQDRIVLSLGRIHPKKGLDRLLAAWSEVERMFPGWRLRIVGPSENGHAEQLSARAASLGLASVSIEPPVYGDAKFDLLRAASLFVLPTRDENFGLAVAEALASGVPVIATKGAPWRRLESEGCGWWVDHGAEPLAGVLGAAMAMAEPQLAAMGQRGRSWMTREFSWDRIARDMLHVYDWLVDKGDDAFHGAPRPGIELNRKPDMLARLLDRYFIKQPKLRRLVTRMVYGSSPAKVNLLGAPLHIHTELENGYLRAFRRTRMVSLFRDEASVMINIAALIGDDCSFVDAGANIGIYSSILSRLRAVKKGLSVFAFEADPRTFERLAMNAKLHGFRCENIALAEEEGALEFVRGAVSHVTTKLESANRYSIAGETFTVRCRPLSAFDIPGSSIVIKIDVEGAEYEVLAGARPYFEQGRVKAVYFDGVDKLAETLAFLAQYDFRVFDGKSLGPPRKRMFSLLAIRAADVPECPQK